MSLQLTSQYLSFKLLHRGKVDKSQLVMFKLSSSQWRATIGADVTCRAPRAEWAQRCGESRWQRQCWFSAPFGHWLGLGPRLSRWVHPSAAVQTQRAVWLVGDAVQSQASMPAPQCRCWLGLSALIHWLLGSNILYESARQLCVLPVLPLLPLGFVVNCKDETKSKAASQFDAGATAVHNFGGVKTRRGKRITKLI